MTSRFNLKLLSVMLALFLWFYVNIIISPTMRRTVKASVEYRNIPPLMRVLPEKTEAEIVLTGTRRDFIFAGRDSILPSIDLYNLRPGKAYFPLKVSTPSGISVVAMRPAQIEITGEALSRKEMEIGIDIKGQPSEGYISEPPVVKPRKVLLEGPGELLEKVMSCQISVTLAEIRNSISEKRPVQLFGTDGEVPAGIRIMPDQVTVDVTVKAGYPSRNVTVVPQFINKPPEGYRLEGFKVLPTSVTISGPGRVLEELSDVRTLPIDLSKIQASTTVTTSLTPPFESVKIVGTPSVTVDISLVTAPLTRLFTGLPLNLQTAPDQHCTVSPASYSMLVQAIPEALKTLSPADLAITLDTRNKKQGSFTVPLPCPKGLPTGVDILEITPSNVAITITPVTPASASEPATRPASSAGDP